MEGAPPPMGVKIAPVAVAEIRETSDYLATLMSRRSIVLQPQIDGQVTQILVSAGDRVQAGQAHPFVLQFGHVHNEVLDVFAKHGLLGVLALMRPQTKGQDQAVMASSFWAHLRILARFVRLRPRATLRSQR